MFTKLSNKIKSILEDNTYIQEVYDYAVQSFSGDPVAVITPSQNESDYRTSNYNERVYAFNVMLFVSRTITARTTGNPEQKAEDMMKDVVGSVLDDFDKNYLFTGIDTPTGYTMINVFALPSNWGYSGGDDEYRVAEINIRCRVYVDVTQIT